MKVAVLSSRALLRPSPLLTGARAHSCVPPELLRPSPLLQELVHTNYRVLGRSLC